MDMNIRIQKCTIDDLKILQELSIKTYYDTFAHLNTKENMEAYLNVAFNENQIIKELKNDDSKFYFIFYNETIVGYFKINEAPSQTDINDDNSLELERIYVLKKYQGLKLGRYILENVISIARKKNKKYVWLGVWEKNEKAISVYNKFGFYQIGTHVFVMGEDIQTDFILKIDL